MGCFACFNPRVKESKNRIEDSNGARSNASLMLESPEEKRKPASINLVRNPSAKSFTFRDLAIATQNFNNYNLIGEGGFGRVFKGRLENGQLPDHQDNPYFPIVDRATLSPSGKRYRSEVCFTNYWHRPDLYLIQWYFSLKLRIKSFCALVHPKPCSNLKPEKPPLDWNTRMKIAVGVAKGLTYLHDVADPPVIYRDMKAANVLLDEDFNPKLSDFGLAKVAPVGDRTHISTRVMGTYGYAAPDYVISGKLTFKSDIYSFGVLMLELITGRRIYDSNKVREEQNLLSWARPFLNDRRKFYQLADPALQCRFPQRAFHQMVVITSMCLQEQPHVRPIIADVVVALTHVASQRCASEPGTAVNSPTLAASPIGTPSRKRNSRRGLVHFQ
ncbi:serine/threonine-protein kinase PBS1-like protein [Carex littledalei]|uniref:Serine/threonine-protein kinase PBS1-like protein n=1 Tax=Carex littledalei TaxID=544730 RepID=A0A833VDV4_9POAL|nr:serine/threonine-protein kinase PBS1-like protein [Carex littledalei]